MIWFTATRIIHVTRDFTNETRCVINAAQVCRIEPRDGGGSAVYFASSEGKEQIKISVAEDVDTLIARMAPE